MLQDTRTAAALSVPWPVLLNMVASSLHLLGSLLRFIRTLWAMITALPHARRSPFSSRMALETRLFRILEETVTGVLFLRYRIGSHAGRGETSVRAAKPQIWGKVLLKRAVLAEVSKELSVISS